MKIKNLALEERPRERLSLYGVSTLSNTELLAIIIGRGVKNKNAMEIAREILTEYRLRHLNEVSFQELEKIRGIGFTKACNIIAAFELGRRAQNFNPISKKKIKTPKEAYSEVRNELMLDVQEKLICLFLNNRSGLIEKKVMFVGTIDKQLVSSRDIVKDALKYGATKVIIAHNHPSEEVTPSSEDKNATKKIMEALNSVNIELVDHLIVSGNNFLSFKEEGIMS